MSKNEGGNESEGETKVLKNYFGLSKSVTQNRLGRFYFWLSKPVEKLPVFKSHCI